MPAQLAPVSRLFYFGKTPLEIGLTRMRVMWAGIAGAEISPPEWSLTGLVVEWPDGQLATLSQSPWSRGDFAWTCELTIPRVVGERTRDSTLRLRIDDLAHLAVANDEVDWVRARELIVQRLRSNYADSSDLGEITIR
jgi:hypothetical protein